MLAHDDLKLVQSWLTMQRNWWAYEALDRLCHDEPDKAWDLVLAIVDAADSNDLLETIGAGPLENLLDKHAPQLIGRVEAALADHPRLARALTSVWLRDDDSDANRRLVNFGCKVVPVSDASSSDA
jgi:uncharacterized protein DUF6869